MTVLNLRSPAELTADALRQQVVRVELWKGDLQTVFGRFQLQRVELDDGPRYQLVAVDSHGAMFLHGTADEFHPDEKIEAETDAEATAVALTVLWNRLVAAMRDFNDLCESSVCEVVKCDVVGV